MMTRLRAHARLLLAVLAVGAVAAVAFWPAAITVDVVTIDRGPLRVTIDEDGVTRVRDRFVISAPVAGRVERITLEPGDPVVHDRTVLARIVPAALPFIDSRARGELDAAVRAAAAAVGQAQAEHSRTDATLDRARSSLKRQRELDAGGLVARDAVEAAETAVRTAEEAQHAATFAVERARYELQVARARLAAPAGAGSAVSLLAPIDGVVLKRMRESETTVPVGEALLEIGDPGRIEIVADLLSTDAVGITPGTRVVIERWGGSEPLDARVRRVEPAGFMKVSALGVEEQRVNVLIDLTADPSTARALGDNYRVEVRVVLSDQSDVLRIPVGGLFRRGEGWACFVIEEGRARLRPVRIAQRNDAFAAITEGVSAGQTVILHPPDTVEDGARIVVRPAR